MDTTTRTYNRTYTLTDFGPDDNADRALDRAIRMAERDGQIFDVRRVARHRRDGEWRVTFRMMGDR